MQEKEVLRNLFLELPPRLEYIEQLLTGNGYSTECITEIFCEFANECHGEYRDFIEEHDREPLDEELRSTYVFPLCKLLLQYGLDPNYVFGEIPNETNALFEIYWIDKPFVAADTLKLLLEHGGDPHLEVGGESIWMTSDFDIWFDVINGYAAEDFFKHTFESHFYFWLVLRGFIHPEEEEYKEYTLFAYKLIEKEVDRWKLQVIRRNEDMDCPVA